MFLLMYRSSKHENMKWLIPEKLYFVQDLRLPVDLLRENLLKSERFSQRLFKWNQRKTGRHSAMLGNVHIKSFSNKDFVRSKIRQIYFEEDQKVWLYNSRRIKGKGPKLQNSWEGLYFVIKRIRHCILYSQVEQE